MKMKSLVPVSLDFHFKLVRDKLNLKNIFFAGQAVCQNNVYGGEKGKTSIIASVELYNLEHATLIRKPYKITCFHCFIFKENYFLYI